MKLDAKTVANLILPEDKADLFIWDDELTGFARRLRRHKGRVNASWCVQYRIGGRSRRVTLSAVLRAAEARQEARRILATVALGSDPQALKEAERRQSTRTLRSTIDAYLEARRSELRPASLRTARLYLTGSYFRTLHGLDISKLTRADIAGRLGTIAREHSPTTAAAARRALSMVLRWAVEEGLTVSNPIIGTRRPANPVARDRVVDDEELHAIWRACPDDDDYGRILRLLILTGARRQEVGGLCWSEIDMASGTWVLPAARAKNNRAHTLTLPAPALAILRSAPRTTRDNIFGRWGSNGFSAWTHSKRELDRRLGDAVAPWRIHDLRRTVATGLIGLGVPPHVVEAVLNHQSGARAGVAGIYNRHPYEREIAAALDRWAAHVTGQTNVSPMLRAV